MTFSSLAFLFVFFPIVFVLYSVCRNNLARNILLVIASLLFYAYGEPVAVFIMLVSIVLNYFFGLLCAGIIGEGSDKRIEILRKVGLIAAVVMNIGLLFVFKYADFFLENLGLARYKPNIALPIGISFFTFQGLSYVIDVYQDKECVQTNLLSVMLYISFFPQLIAGPIVKYHDIREQLKEREFNVDRISRGLQRFAFGLGKKVLIAGPMGLIVDSIYALDVSGIGIATAWIGAISYSLQIFFDFSGYSDMAIGLGCIFGFDFKENFNKPYAAANMKDFWRRWHISLSTWFKEYVYIPLGGNRKGYGRTYINKFIVFLLTGLWHGANWTFIVWGMMHGLALIAEDLIKRFVKIGEKIEEEPSEIVEENLREEKTDEDEPREIVEENTGVDKPDEEKPSEKKAKSLGKVFLSILGHGYTLFYIMITFVVFRADNISGAFRMIGRLFIGNGSNAIAFSLCTPVYLTALVFALILSTSVIDKLFAKFNVWIMRLLAIFIYILSIMMLISGGYNPFIYFRF